jgi:lipoyl(octanoyl) transferase
MVNKGNLQERESMLLACFFGFEQPYLSAMRTMQMFHEQVSEKKISNQLMLLEHKPVITLTRQYADRSIMTSVKDIENDGISVVMTDRGGDATFHGPGQLVGYPVISLQSSFACIDISKYIRSLERALLNAINELGVTSAHLLPGFTGIWIKCVENERLLFKKLAAFGIGIKDGATKHGFALNIDIDYQRYIKHIVPCGLKDRGVITLKEVFSQQRLEMPSYFVIVKTVSESLAKTFSLTLTWSTAESLPMPSIGA